MLKSTRGALAFGSFVIIFCFIFKFDKNPTYFNTKMGDRKEVEYCEDRGLNNFLEQLWDLDENRLVPDKDYDLDLQGRTRYSMDGPDKAEDPLFAMVDPSVFQRPTYKAFMALLDNYESATGVAESVTAEELQENWNFINLVFDTEVMQLAYKFLKYKGKASTDAKTFKQEFHDMWFKLYKRSRGTRQCDSSGFEHVFVGETRGEKEVIGFHNWIQFYLQEKAGNVDYKGFMSSDKNPHLLTIQFSWKGEMKPKGSTFIGVSPEFEIALYTVCYLMGHDAYKITLNDEPVIIKCYKTAGKIGTCYPQMPSWQRRK